MKGCDHNKVYSGAINLERRFSWICRRCGEMGWDNIYDLSQVSADEFHAQRVVHGWATPSRLPPPPRVPTGTTRKRFRSPAQDAATSSGAMALLFCVLGVRWFDGSSVLPPWSALLGAGSCLLLTTFAYVAWKKGY